MCRHERDAAEVVAALVARHPDVRQVGVPQRLEVRPRRLDVRAWRETPNHAQPPALLRLQTLLDEHDGNGDVERRTGMKPEESRWRDADDGHPLRADLDALAEYARSRPKRRVQKASLITATAPPGPPRPGSESSAGVSIRP